MTGRTLNFVASAWSVAQSTPAVSEPGGPYKSFTAGRNTYYVRSERQREENIISPPSCLLHPIGRQPRQHARFRGVNVERGMPVANDAALPPPFCEMSCL